MVLKYGFDLRQTGDTLSSLGGGAILQEGLRPILLLAVLHRCCKGEDYSICVLIGLSLGVTATGFFDVFFAAVAIILPLYLRSIFKGHSLLGYYIGLPLLLVMLISAGFLNKISIEDLEIRLNDGVLISYISEYLFYRLNVWSGSLVFYLNNGSIFSVFNTELITVYIDNFLYRISQLLPIFEIDRPSITNASRLNFLNIMEWDRDTEPGLSAGPIAYALLLPFPIISLALVSGYCALILRLLSNIVKSIGRLPKGETAVQLLLIPFLLIFILVPFDSFLMIGPSMVAFFYLAVLSLVK